MVHGGYIEEVRDICNKKKIWLIEDTCESLGVKKKINIRNLLVTLVHTVLFFTSHYNCRGGNDSYK